MSDSDDDKPISSLIRKLLPTRKPNSQRQTEPEEKPAKKVKVEGGASKSKSEKAEARAANGDSSKRTTTSSSGGGTGSAKRSMAFYEETDKGMLVQRLLVRWWYAIEWPRPEEIGQPPVGYEALEGFPGVFISTKSDSLGTIMDLRNKATCPSLVNLSSWPSAKLKETLERAYTEQMRQLVEAEGEDCKLHRLLRSELKEVRKVDADKADREAKKFHFGGK